jgi:hypothetical protein
MAMKVWLLSTEAFVSPFLACLQMLFKMLVRELRTDFLLVRKRLSRWRTGRLQGLLHAILQTRW